MDRLHQEQSWTQQERAECQLRARQTEESVISDSSGETEG